MARISRRAFVAANTAGLLAAKQVLRGEQRTIQRSRFASVQAVVFDTFGTVVDWRSSVQRQVADLARRKGLRIDAGKFTDAWRAGYRPTIDKVRSGALPWTSLDALHRLILDGLLSDFDLEGKLTDTEVLDLNRSWHRLEPWSDAVAGLRRMKKKFIIAPLSNGNVALMTRLAKHAGLPWDFVYGADLARHYKPDREIYRTAVDLLDLQPDQVMLVAAHLGDLTAAKAAGLSTAFVVRPLEFGAGGGSSAGKPDREPNAATDLSARDFGELATALGA